MIGTRPDAVVFTEIAKQHRTAFVPFLLERVGGHLEFNQSDGIHPNADGHRKVAKNVWVHLLSLL